MINEQNEPQEGAACPLSHRVVSKTLFAIIRLMLISIAACLIYLVYTSR